MPVCIDPSSTTTGRVGLGLSIWISLLAFVFGSCGSQDSRDESVESEACADEDTIDFQLDVTVTKVFVALDLPPEWCLSEELNQNSTPALSEVPMLMQTFVGPGQFPDNHNTLTVSVTLNESSQSVEQVAERMEAVTSPGEWSEWSSVPLRDGEALERALTEGEYDVREAVVLLGEWEVQIGGFGVDANTIDAFVKGLYVK